MDFPPENGPIKGAVSFGGFMEVYTVHATYRVKTPDSLDPRRSVPNMPWAQSVQAPMGSSNPIVARIVIQLVEALGTWPLRNAKAETIKRHLHARKEEALICEAAYNRLKAPCDAAVARIREGKLMVQRNVVECPSLPNLRDEAGSFLNSTKRSLQSVGDVFNQFYVPDGKKPMVANANFEYGITRLENSQPVNQELIDYLRDVVPITKHFVDLRNGLEHPSDKDSTIVEDFRLTPEGIVPPSWWRGSVVGVSPIVDEMHAFLEFLIDFCENVFFFGLIDNVSINLPFRLAVEPIPPHEIDPECPVRYRIGLHQLPDATC